MTIDEALEAASQTDQCGIVFSSTTGEVLMVEGVGKDESPAEVIRHLQGLASFGQPVMTRYFTSADVTRQVLEQQRAETERIRTRVQVLTAWSAAPVEELVQVLERGEYDYPMGNFDTRIIVDHLWQVHRDELTPPLRERLRTLLTRNVLCGEAARRLCAYLAALEGDEALLKALWIKAETERYSLNDLLALLECFAYVQTHDQQVIHDLMAVFETDMLFGAKFDMMIILGQIGSAAGIHAAATIRRTMINTQPWVIAAQNRVLARLETEDDQWARCGDCCYGRVHNQDTHGEWLCLTCYGIGFVPLDTAQSQERDP